ncbi:MAG: CinA family nicotinamide mononucleotide deamidase-related protein [Gammaproteobacteria bacterium]|nr:CinA family nicotinamide mononucleotide deamidase-related protein [Gammaproteobacteria bacterium]
MTKQRLKATILATGEEVLRGELTDSNSPHIADKLGELGIDVELQLTAGDRPEDLKWAMQTLLGRSDILVISGGLGPTEDDLTTVVAAELAGVETFFDESSWQQIVSLFEQYRIPLSENNRKQAYFPLGATILENPRGTAPGFELPLELDGEQKWIIALPGPPAEMQPMLATWLTRRFPGGENQGDLFIRLLGIGESTLAEALEPWSARWGPVSYRVQFPEIQIKLYRPEPAKAAALCDFLTKNLAPYLVDFSARTTAELFADYLLENRLTFAAAESCSGGLLSKILTDAPGSSRYFLGGVVSYHNDIKQSALGVDPKILATEGAVSESVALQMASGIRSRFKSDLSLSITGIAGPDGGTPEKPVGTVWMGKATAEGVEAKLMQMFPGRNRVRGAAPFHGMHWIIASWLETRRARYRSSLSPGISSAPQRP